MTDHAAIVTALAKRKAEAWKAYRAHATTVTELSLLSLAHMALDLDPTATYVWLDVHDEADHMTFGYVATETGWWAEDSTPNEAFSEPQREMTDEQVEAFTAVAEMLDHVDMAGPWWIERGSRRMGGKGELTIAVVIEHLHEEYHPTDPMPDPTDLPALREWLDRQET